MVNKRKIEHERHLFATYVRSRWIIVHGINVWKLGGHVAEGGVIIPFCVSGSALAVHVEVCVTR